MESPTKNQEGKTEDFSGKVLMRPPSKTAEQKDEQPGKKEKKRTFSLLRSFEEQLPCTDILVVWKRCARGMLSHLTYSLCKITVEKSTLTLSLPRSVS